MKAITANINLIAYCGLYCGACRQYLNEKCPGCRDNVKATWCKVRSCNVSNEYRSCAACVGYQDVNACKKFNNIFSKVIGFIFRSDRKACIESIRQHGYDEFAATMAQIKKHSLPRK